MSNFFRTKDTKNGIYKVLYNICKGKSKNTEVDTYSVISMLSTNLIIKGTVERTKELLIQKQFSNSIIESRVEKTVLLATEISELADAVKKGLGKDAEAEELADIIIRGCNFLCSNETYNHYKNLCMALESKGLFNSDFSVKVNKSYFISKEILEVESKFRVIEAMMEAWGDIKNQSVKYINTYKKRTANDEYKEFLALWSKLMNLFCYCEFYSVNFLDNKLHLAINNKMNSNFKRPIRYNSCEEMYKINDK